MNVVTYLVYAKAQYVVSCLVIRAVALSPSRQRRQLREKHAERSVGRQARRTATVGLS
jgi:ribosomal protein S26